MPHPQQHSETPHALRTRLAEISFRSVPTTTPPHSARPPSSTSRILMASAAMNRASTSDTSRRIACLLVKDLPLAATVRANPDLREAAFALSIGKGPRAPLGFVSAAAKRAGVVPGMTVAQARTVAPALMALASHASLSQVATD